MKYPYSTIWFQGDIRFTNIILQVWIFKRDLQYNHIAIQSLPKARDSFFLMEKWILKNSFLESFGTPISSCKSGFLKRDLKYNHIAIQSRPKARDSYSFIEKTDTKNSFMESHTHKQVLLSQIAFL